MTRLAVSLALLAGLFLAVGQADAQYNLRRYIWDNDNSNNNWADDANWRIEWDADGDWGTDTDRVIYNDPADLTYGYSYPTGSNAEAAADSVYVEIDPAEYDPGTATINVNAADCGTWKWGGFNVRAGASGDITLSSGSNTLLCHQFVNDTANSLTISCDSINIAGKSQFVTNTSDASGEIVIDGGISGDTTIDLQPQGAGKITYTSNVTVGGTPGNWYPYHPGDLDMIIERADLLSHDWYPYMAPNNDGTDTGRLRLIWGVQSTGITAGVNLRSVGGEVQYMATGAVSSNIVIGRMDNNILGASQINCKMVVGGNYDAGAGICDVTLIGQAGTVHQRIDLPVEVLAGSTLYINPDAHMIVTEQVGATAPDISGAGAVVVMAGSGDFDVQHRGGTISCDITVQADAEFKITGGTVTGDVDVAAGATAEVYVDYRGAQTWAVTSDVTGSGKLRVTNNNTIYGTLQMEAGGSLAATLDMELTNYALFDMNYQGNVAIDTLTSTSPYPSQASVVETRGDTLTISAYGGGCTDVRGGSGALVFDGGGTSTFDINGVDWTGDCYASAELDVSGTASVTLDGRIVLNVTSGLEYLNPTYGDSRDNLVDCGEGLGGTTFSSVGWTNAGVLGFELTYDDTGGAVNLLIHVAGDADLADPGDGSRDCDLDDLGIMAGNYGTPSGMVWTDGDFNQDGAVNLDDLGILAGNYNQSWTPPTSTVPEPITLSLLGLGGLALLRRRR